MARFPLPSIEQLTNHVLAAWRFDYKEQERHQRVIDEEEQWCDVRLASAERRSWYNASWWLNFGSADFDSRHGDVCGATSYKWTDRPSRKAAREIALDLLAQCRDQIAELNVTA
jgi:hypothetical protein